METQRTDQRPPFGVNLYGYLTSNLGLGVAGRNTAEMLMDAGVPLKLVDVNPGGGMQGRHTALAADIERSTSSPYYAVNLFHINPDQILYQLSPFSGRVRLADRINACVPFWELPRLPRSWIEPLRAMDAVLAPTRFVQQALESALPDATVFHYPQGVHVPGNITADRVAFDIPVDDFAFVMSFDMRSDIERKNPWGAIDAFRRAFPDRTGVRLVIKANNVDTIAGLDRHVQRLRDVAQDDRIDIIDRQMSYREILTLYASCDALVSLHRSEGLGLSLLEAMALGKPVVATGWSGNMDFMTPDNSVPIGFSKVEVASSTQPAYGKGTSGIQYWADPDINEAASWMRRLAEEPALAQSLGARARADVAALTARYDSGTDVIAPLESLLAQPDDSSHDHASRMRELRARYPVNQARRIVRAVVNRARTRMGL